MNVLYPSSSNFWYPRVFEWSNGTYSLLLNGTDEEDFALLLDCCVTLEEDFAELLDATLEEDFTLLLDFALELDCGVTLEEDFAELLDATLEEDFTLLLDFALLLDTLVSLTLDFGVTLEEEDLAELLDTLVSSSLDCGVTSSILLDDSSSRGAKLLSSSPHAVKESPATARNIAKETRKERLIYPPNAVLSQNTNENIT